jgi:long-chain acyl-CoA synthetase
LGIQVLAGYGLTETANLVSGNLDMENHPNSVGKQYPGQEARIVHEELQVRGDMLFDGYWKDDCATSAAFDDGWFKTGDLARIDEDGFIYIVGRIKNLILLGNGENVSPEEVEEAFYRSANVQDCLVSETVIAGNPVIQLEVLPAEGASDEAIYQEMKTIRASLPSTMQPARIIIRHEPFAKNASMKIIRAK